MRLRFLAPLVALASAAFAAPADPAALAVAVNAALRARDVSALVALVHAEGMTESDKAAAANGLAGLIPPADAESVLVGSDRLPDLSDIGQPVVARGRRIELTAPPAGIIRIAYKQGRSSLVSTLPYVKVAGGCLLAGHRITDLGWKGPADRQLGYTFADDYPPHPASITIRYNASGVDLTRASAYHSGTLIGQHIDEFTIEGLPEGFKGRLVLREGKEEIFRSEPIVGQSRYTYRRAAP